MGQHFACPFRHSLPFIIFVSVGRSMTFFRFPYSNEGRIGTTPQNMTGWIGAVFGCNFFRFPGVKDGMVGTVIVIRHTIDLSLIGHAGSVFSGGRQRLRVVPRPIR